MLLLNVEFQVISYAELLRAVAVAHTILNMPNPTNHSKLTGPTIRPIFQGYEQGGLLYFSFDGREMVAIVRDRAEFDSHRERGTSLQAYCDSLVSTGAYGAAPALEELIPKESE